MPTFDARPFESAINASGDDANDATRAALFDVQTTEGLAAIAAVRERFLDDPLTDLAGIRPRIARSWRRCAAMKVDPDAPLEFDFDSRIDEQTKQCLEPFLREVERLAFDAGGDVTVITPDGVLVHDLTPELVDRYEHGRVLLESVSGTNGDGTALEEGHGGWVYSQEHYREDMMTTACYTVLIRDPFRDNVRACVSLTLPEMVISASDARAVGLVMEGMAAKTVRELAKRSASREQKLFAEYLRMTRRFKSGAVLATDGKNFTLSDPALEFLREDDFAAVSSYAQHALRTRSAAEHDLTLSGERPVRLSISLPGDLSDPLGAVLVVKPLTAKRSGRSSSQRAVALPLPEATLAAAKRFAPEWVGDNTGYRKTLAAAEASAESGTATHLLGERGTGKRSFARALAQRWSDSTLEIACSKLRGRADGLVSEAVALVHDGGSLVLLDIEALPDPVSESLAAGLSQADLPRVAMTLRRPNLAATRVITAVQSVEITVPPLSSRREDIAALATHFIAEVTDKAPSPRLLYVLAQADWPGNVSQLKSVVVQAVANARGSSVDVDHLPQAFRGGAARSSLSRLEEVELEEVRSALAEAGGNRSVAADILQIGRSTLYRRLDSYKRRGIVV